MIIFCLFGCGSLMGQGAVHQSRIIDAKIDLKRTELQGPYIIIEYEIPYSGMVEIRLYDKRGEKVWQNQYPESFGENKIVLKASKFNPGETYTYALNYKKDEVTEKIMIPPTGFD